MEIIKAVMRLSMQGHLPGTGNVEEEFGSRGNG
jgi:hypothetical protein